MSKRTRLCVACGVLCILACGSEHHETARDGHAAVAEIVSQADPENLLQVTAGEIVYQAHCATCHGRKLEGQPNWRRQLLKGGYPAPPHDGSGHTWRHGDRELFDATKLGGEASAGPGNVSHMPGFVEVLSDKEIWAAIAYIKNHWSTRLRERQQLANRGEAHVHHKQHSGH